MQPRLGRFEEGLTALAQRRQTRRGLLAGSAKLAAGGALAAIFAGPAAGWTAAQGTPVAGAGLAGLGLPELKITATDSSYAGLPAQTAAGWYLVTFTNSTQGLAALDLMQLPQGMSAADFKQLLQAAAATPAAGTPGAQEAGGPPPWYYEVYMAGGAAAAPGQTVQAVVELRPGDYVAWGEDPSAPQAPVALTVTPGGSAAAPRVAADVTVHEVHTDSGFAFQFDGEFKAGPQIVKVVNDSKQPHFVEWDQVPAGTTLEQVMQAIMAPQGATPAPGGLNPRVVKPVALAGTQSAGTTTYHALTLDAGTYMVACWVADPTKGGEPHAMEGMINIITAGGAATPAS